MRSGCRGRSDERWPGRPALRQDPGDYPSCASLAPLAPQRNHVEPVARHRPISFAVTVTVHAEKGVMDTHDEETKRFFAHSNVRVRLVYRGWRDQKNMIRCLALGSACCNVQGHAQAMFDGRLTSHRSNVVTTTFTHHQKCVILDACGSQSPATQRHVIAFVGGIDLTSGAALGQYADHALYAHMRSANAVRWLCDCSWQAVMTMPATRSFITLTRPTSGNT